MFENSNVLKGYLICSAKTCWKKYHILLFITKVVIYAGGIYSKQFFGVKTKCVGIKYADA